MTDACLPQRPGPARRDASSQRGSVLVWAAFVILMVLGVIASGTSSDQAHDALASAELAGGGQARAVAEGGLVDGSRLVPPPAGAAGARPSCRAATSPPGPPVNETDDGRWAWCASTRSLPSLWGRYELRLTTAGGAVHRRRRRRTLRRGRVPTPMPTATAAGTGCAGCATSRLGRGLPGTGAVWLIESRGLPLQPASRSTCR